MTVRLVKPGDIDELAPIYVKLYSDVDIGELWSLESAKELLQYWYKKQGDLFYVAEVEGNVVGAIMSGVKPWFDGNRLIDTELFVSEEHQHMHIAKALVKQHLQQANAVYSCRVIEFHTYGSSCEFPQIWYKKLGFKATSLTVMEANIQEALRHLG